MKNDGKVLLVVLSMCLLVFLSVQWDTALAAEKYVTLPAKPEPIDIDLLRTAVIIVDMQNAFVTKGGMVDLVGRDMPGKGQDISANRVLIASIKKTADAARAAGAKVIYLTNEYSGDMSDSGGPGSPNWHKEFALAAMNKNPQYKGKFLIKGSWDAAVVDELKPQPGDVVIGKSRYSGFRGTSLDVVLKTYNIKYLVFTGIATNICVESTLRDAYFLDYWPVLVSDTTNNAGPPVTQQATLWNVEAFFGWVTTSIDFVRAISAK